ncbi:MAG: hypothetical protein DME08_11715 [Candidatus Rokuibacteriota bacterium]|nr:MAG: hypothetical protein DME08_11715 [Candidatus Rokubacteria bacterium]
MRRRKRNWAGCWTTSSCPASSWRRRPTFPRCPTTGRTTSTSSFAGTSPGSDDRRAVVCRRAELRHRVRAASNCLEGHPSADTIPALAPRPDELVVRKHWYDGFHGTPLDGALRARGVTSLVVTGTLTDICVLASIVGAFNREYRVTVAEDAVATLWPEIQRATLDIIGRAFGRVVSSKDIASEVTAW